MFQVAIEEDMDGEILLGMPDEDDLLTVCNSPHPGRPHIFAGGRNHQLVQYTLQGEEVHAYDLPGYASATVTMPKACNEIFVSMINRVVLTPSCSFFFK